MKKRVWLNMETGEFSDSWSFADFDKTSEDIINIQKHILFMGVRYGV